MSIVARVETTDRKIGIVVVGNGYQLRDITHGESGSPGTVDGIGRVLGNPYHSLSVAMCEAVTVLTGETVMIPVRKATAMSSDDYLTGNERSLGMGPDEF